MPSSTSSSSDRVPSLPPRRLWALTVVLCLGVFGGVEAFWRSQGHRVSIVDDLALWSFHRARVNAGGKQTVVLVGASRSQVGFATDTFRKRFLDYKVVQLSIDGHAPREILRDLANDPDFCGVVLCSTSHAGLVHNVELDSDVSAWLGDFHSYRSFDRKANRDIASWLQSHVVLIGAHISTRAVLKRLLQDGRLPGPSYVITHFDRSCSADYSLTDVAEHRQNRIDMVFQAWRKWSASELEKWPAQVAETERLVDRIQARGGRVVFFNYPVTGASLSVPEMHYPKAQFWDRFAEITDGVAIHFLDVPAMRGFDCPDTSHLDCRDKAAFTNALLDELARRGVLPADAPGLAERVQGDLN